MRKYFSFFYLLSFIFLVVLANWLTSSYGLVPVGLGLYATAGTFAAGLTFVFRDMIHENFKSPVVFLAIVVGALISYLIASPVIAIASGITFLLAETLDMLVYKPLRKKGFFKASIVSNVVGFTTDTFLFLYLAGFALTVDTVAGQLWVKALMTLLGVGIIYLFKDKLLSKK